ncbi:MAG: sugar-binding domain-containing protein [Terrisporobacter sp.]|uniref:sugar-binding transcriptional regulator n=1 Tax=Terrisporobacter sp. TaxID=1965305 RepID=UPI002FC91729
MKTKEEKIKRLINICKKYYEENYTQNQIAKEYNISRPMVSKLLTEAKNMGIVKIEIDENFSDNNILDRNIKKTYKVNQVYIVNNTIENEKTDEEIVRKSYEVINSLMNSNDKIGIGWGSMIGKLMDYYDKNAHNNSFLGHVYPLIGGIMASYRNYQTNELVRIFASKNNLNSHYIYAPAIVENEKEKNIYMYSQMFKDINKGWENLDLAIINISNFPSSPDVATSVRFGNKLIKEKACGHFISHFYNDKGNIIKPEFDYVINININQLKKCKRVLAICSSKVSPKSIIGALNTGLITDLIISDELGMKII